MAGGIVKKGRFTQPSGGHGPPGRSRAPDAGCGPGGIFTAVSPGPARSAVGWQPHRAARASPRPPPETPGAEGPDLRTFLTASYSVLLYVYLPTPEPPGPGECAGSARNKPSRELPDYI